MTYSRKVKSKLRQQKRRSLTAHSLEDAKFRPRIVRSRIKYTRKGKANDRQRIRHQIEDG